MTRLFIMRHGEAETPRANQADCLRQLTAHGQQQAARMGRWLAEQGESWQVWSSPFVRAEQTARQVLGQLPADIELRLHDFLTYLAEPSALLSLLLENNTPAQNLLIVSHMPIVAQWVALLTADPHLLQFDTAAVVELRLDSPMAGGASFIRYQGAEHES